MGLTSRKNISDWFAGLKGRLSDGTFAPRGNGSGLMAVSPLLVFLLVYLLSSVAAGDFYKVPITAAFLIASVYAVAIGPVRGGNLPDRVAAFSKGAGERNVLLMLWIFILAGAFAGSAKAIGAVDATVGITLRLLPGKMLLAGLFLAACFISMAVGTSVGTIVALVPIAAGIASQTAAEPALLVGIIVGGAFFGDNLSFISDTTIAATKTQGCAMADKFKANLWIALPAALAVTVLYLFLGRDGGAPVAAEAVKPLLILPYLLVIVLAVCGMDVLAVLVTGTVANALIGILGGSVGWIGFMKACGDGIASMGELIIVTMLAGGLLELIRQDGGLEWMIRGLTRSITGKRGAELSIAALVSLVNVCTANNTIAIITSGALAKEITERFGLDPRKTASILDTFSCLVQGILPYGAQMLMASGLAGIAATAIIPHLYYPFALGAVALLAILLRLPRKYS